MTDVQPNPSPFDSGESTALSRRASGQSVLRPLGDPGTSLFGHSTPKPRVKMLATDGDLSPTGASFTPPSATPIPARGTGLQLFISAVAAFVAVVFLTLLASKL